MRVERVVSRGLVVVSNSGALVRNLEWRQMHAERYRKRSQGPEQTQQPSLIAKLEEDKLRHIDPSNPDCTSRRIDGRRLHSCTRESWGESS
jgi:hypothetical protein